jgi:excinuclease ABC subunit A
VIEHNSKVIRTADWVLYLGPEGGDNGGELLAERVPQDVAKEPRSYAGSYIKPLLLGAEKPASGRRGTR